MSPAWQRCPADFRNSAFTSVYSSSDARLFHSFGSLRRSSEFFTVITVMDVAAPVAIHHRVLTRMHVWQEDIAIRSCQKGRLAFDASDWPSNCWWGFGRLHMSTSVG